MQPYYPNLAATRPVVVDDLIRLGRDNDGGYVVSARSVEHVAVLIGLGINTDWSFEADVLERNPSAHFIGVDGSISNPRFLRDSLWHGLRAAIITAKGRLGDAREEWRRSREWATVRREFHAFFHGPHRVHMEAMIGDAHSGGTSWKDVVDQVPAALRNPATPTWFVKVDIEGAEFRVLPELMESARHIRGLVIEFHETDTRAHLLDDIITLLKEQFVIVHVHGNNYAPMIKGTGFPLGLELSLVHRSLVTADELARVNTRTYPIPDLDQPNRAGWPDLELVL